MSEINNFGHKDPLSGIDRLIALMARLRRPVDGCPWDLEQNFKTIAPYTIEEAYEVADAIERENLNDLKDELGDLLFQVVFHSQMAAEQGLFSFDAVAHHCTDKMVRRHPHIFKASTESVVLAATDDDRAGDGENQIATQVATWEKIKEQERRDKQAGQAFERASELGALSGVPVNLPALTRSVKIQKRAARVGFDWPEIEPVFAKIDEEIHEVRDALSADCAAPRVDEEIGDLLFAVTNLARHLSVDPEGALRRATAKFERRFAAMEQRARAEGQDFAALTLDQQESLWGAVKQAAASRVTDPRQ